MAAIDVGSGAIDRGFSLGAGATFVDTGNTANNTGTLTSFEIWASLDMTETNKMGTFSVDGSSQFTHRDYETLGNVAAGSKQTFSGLNCDVVTGDAIGMYWSVGNLVRDNTGGVAIYYKEGDQFGAGQQIYTEYLGYALSLYATGATAEGRKWVIFIG